MRPIKAQALFLGRDDLATVIMSAGGTDMVRPLQLSAIGAFGMGIGRERMMRAPHVPLGRRCFSFWNRHGGNPFLNEVTRFCRQGLKGPNGKQGAEVNRNRGAAQERGHS